MSQSIADQINASLERSDRFFRAIHFPDLYETNGDPRHDKDAHELGIATDEHAERMAEDRG